MLLSLRYVNIKNIRFAYCCRSHVYDYYCSLIFEAGGPSGGFLGVWGLGCLEFGAEGFLCSRLGL